MRDDSGTSGGKRNATPTRNFDGRLNQLESQFGIARSAPRYLVILMDAGKELGPAEEAYIETLDAAGLLFTGGVGLVDLSKMPDGQNGAKE
jgi:hypothetical protein